MATKKSTAAKIDPENPAQVLKEGTCPTSSGKSNLGYQIGVDDSGVIQLRVSSNDGGGFFSNEWISFTDIQAAINDWPEDQGITSMTFRKIFRASLLIRQDFSSPYCVLWGYWSLCLVSHGYIKPAIHPLSWPV
jgi:hypothetical protein